jgi:hypothetical protein
VILLKLADAWVSVYIHVFSSSENLVIKWSYNFPRDEEAHWLWFASRVAPSFGACYPAFRIVLRKLA